MHLKNVEAVPTQSGGSSREANIVQVDDKLSQSSEANAAELKVSGDSTEAGVPSESTEGGPGADTSLVCWIQALYCLMD